MSKKLMFIAIVFACFTAQSCKKETVTVTVPATNCDVRGTYIGTGTSSTSSTTPLTYKLLDDNFAVGSVTPTGPAVTHGGYSNTCDSVFISAYYAGDDAYYLFKGKLSNSGTTINGTFQNLTVTSDFGTFTMSK